MVCARRALFSCGVGVLLTASTLGAQGGSGLVEGKVIDSPELTDSLARPYWRALAGIACPQVQWTPNYRSLEAFVQATKPVLQRLKVATGAAQPAAGFLLDRVSLYRGPRYTVDRLVIADRTPSGSHYGTLGLPVGTTGPVPLVILLHGSGMHPREAFGVDASTLYRPKERADHSAFVRSALELVEAGYAVYVPWISDDQESDRFPIVPWSLLQRSGASIGARLRAGGPYQLVLNEVMGAIDFFDKLPDIDGTRIAVMGWSEGADIASVAAAVDQRVSAVVRLEAPLDRRALRTTVDGVIQGSQFTHIDCALGDFEMASLTAPRALLYAYSTADESVSRFAPFISPSLPTRIKSMYAQLGVPERFSVQSDAKWGATRARRVRVWLDSAMHHSPRAMPDSVPVPRFQRVETYLSPWRDSTNFQRLAYTATLGPCVRNLPKPASTSLADYVASTAPLRRAVAAALHIAPVARTAPFKVLKRYIVSRQPGYLLEFVSIQSAKSQLPLMGLLATPLVVTNEKSPAIVSLDANYGLGRPFGIPGKEASPYLNAYASELAARGSVVFAPYLPLDFPEVAALELNARTPNSVSSYSLTVPMYSAAVDFVLSLPEVDASRVTMWGISYSGTVAAYTAALDQRVTSLVYSNPVVTVDVLYQVEDSALLSGWWTEVCSTLDATLTYLIAPRLFIRENGVRDANGYERTPLESVMAIQDVYQALGVEQNFELVRHDGGHETRPSSAPPETH